MNVVIPIFTIPPCVADLIEHLGPLAVLTGDTELPTVYAPGVRTWYNALHTYLTEQAPPNMIPCIVIASADESNNDEYVAQVNTHPGQAGSFVTITIRAGHPLHPFMREKIGMLNLAGEGEAIEGLGENHSKAHYNVYITPEQHDIICTNGEHTDLRTNKAKE